MKHQEYDIFMNFCVAPQEINKQGGQNKLRGVSKNHEKINVSPCLFWTWEYNKVLTTPSSRPPLDHTCHHLEIRNQDTVVIALTYQLPQTKGFSYTSENYIN